jgi:hypothetical protein
VYQHCPKAKEDLRSLEILELILSIFSMPPLHKFGVIQKRLSSISSILIKDAVRKNIFAIGFLRPVRSDGGLHITTQALWGEVGHSFQCGPKWKGG